MLRDGGGDPLKGPLKANKDKTEPLTGWGRCADVSFQLTPRFDWSSKAGYPILLRVDLTCFGINVTSVLDVGTWEDAEQRAFEVIRDHFKKRYEAAEKDLSSLF